MGTQHKISPFTSIVVFVCMALVGLLLLPSLPVRLLPSDSMPELVISFDMPDNSSLVVESEVTSKLEAMCARVDGVNKISSVSNNGFGQINLKFDKHTDMDMARFKISTLIRQMWSELPEEAGYPTVASSGMSDSGGKMFMTYNLNAPASTQDIMRYAEDNIVSRLSAIDGIGSVSVDGATPMEWQLTYDYDVIDKLGISTGNIVAALSDYYGRDFLGVYPTAGGGRIAMTLSSEGSDRPFDPREIGIKSSSGEVVTLDRIASAVHKEQRPHSYSRINGLNSVYISLKATETANRIKLGDEVREAMAAIGESMPQGYTCRLEYDETEYIGKELDTILFRSSLTILILILFVVVTTRNLRYILLVLASLAVNIAISFIFYKLFGVELQLYSLAGITISLNLMLDNIIVMSDHIRHRHNLSAFMSILAATLTTVGALSIIFFMDESVKLNLKDFAAVIIVNMAVSLIVALFFVPAVMTRMGMGAGERKKSRFSSGIKRRIVKISHIYNRLIRWMSRHKKPIIALFILSFGLPVFMLPDKIKSESIGATIYNTISDNKIVSEYVRPVLNKTLGGTLRLFVEDVYDGSYFSRTEGEKSIGIRAYLPQGSTIEQMNSLVSDMEAFISNYDGIRLFRTSINDPKEASITVFIEKRPDEDSLAHEIESGAIEHALTLGGGHWQVWGISGMPFNNGVSFTGGNNATMISGYNYDELISWAERFCDTLGKNPRIKDIDINSEYSWIKEDNDEFVLQVDKERLAKENISVMELFAALRAVLCREMPVGQVSYGGSRESVRLSSLQSDSHDVWALVNMPMTIKGQEYKIGDFASVKKEHVPKKIVKEQQQYVVAVQHSYLGDQKTGERLHYEKVEELNQLLPVGYRAEVREYNYQKDNSSGYLLLIVVVAIVFLTTGILFNSLKQPFVIIFEVPVSYIGVFLTFYLFDLKFDSGGFAAFVLLCGITVNAGIYLLDEYNRIRRRYPNLSARSAYVRAWNSKVIPISLTILSTVLGFIPFIVGEIENFWFQLAAGTIGGLIMSVVGIFVLIPIFLTKNKKDA